MSDILFWVVVGNIVLFGGLAIWGARYVLQERSPRIRTLGWALVAVSVAFVLASLPRVAMVAIHLGWIPSGLSEFLESGWVLVQSVLVLAIGVAALVVIGRVGKPLRQADRIVSIISERLLAGASLEDYGFTSREMEVLEVIAEGIITDREISELLYISPATAATHVRNILKKSGVKSRRDLALLIQSEP
jgi:DNA-binding CsgD family transcriptional regulator